jgi:hypothetical protein
MDKMSIDTEENDPKLESIRQKNKKDEEKYIKENKERGKCSKCLIY